MADWYYVENDVRQGPVQDAILLKLWKGGTITADTLIWKDGMQEWRPAGQIVKQPSGGTPPSHTRNDSNAGAGQVSVKSGTYCRACGKSVMAQAVVCPACGCAPQDGREFCRHCGNPTNILAKVCVRCGGDLSIQRGGSKGIDKQTTTFLLCMLLGIFAVHRFYLGKKNAILMLVASVFTLSLAGSVWALLDLVRIGNGTFLNGEEEPLGEPIRWMQILSLILVAVGALSLLMTLVWIIQHMDTWHSFVWYKNGYRYKYEWYYNLCSFLHLR